MSGVVNPQYERRDNGTLCASGKYDDASATREASCDSANLALGHDQD